MTARICSFIGKYMAWIVLSVTMLSLFVPAATIWIPTSCITWLLMIIMFCMGMVIRMRDFAIVFYRPRDIILGCVAQYSIMPLLAYALGKAFALDDALLAGVILVGCCPGGTSSNVITYLSRGDVALSVGMTSVNTLLAPLLTPLITYLILSTTIHVDMLGMFLAIVKVVIIPICLGACVNRLLKERTAQIADMLPAISVLAISTIVATVVSHNAEKIVDTGVLVFLVVMLHNVLGYACGYGLGLVLRLPLDRKKALAVEIGMQNSGLATSLASSTFPHLVMATVPGALFSVWHNISGAMLANWLRRQQDG